MLPSIFIHKIKSGNDAALEKTLEEFIDGTSYAMIKGMRGVGIFDSKSTRNLRRLWDSMTEDVKTTTILKMCTILNSAKKLGWEETEPSQLEILAISFLLNTLKYWRDMILEKYRDTVFDTLWPLLKRETKNREIRAPMDVMVLYILGYLYSIDRIAPGDSKRVQYFAYLYRAIVQHPELDMVQAHIYLIWAQMISVYSVQMVHIIDDETVQLVPSTSYEGLMSLSRMADQCYFSMFTMVMATDPTSETKIVRIHHTLRCAASELLCVIVKRFAITGSVDQLALVKLLVGCIISGIPLHDLERYEHVLGPRDPFRQIYEALGDILGGVHGDSAHLSGIIVPSFEDMMEQLRQFTLNRFNRSTLVGRWIESRQGFEDDATPNISFYKMKHEAWSILIALIDRERSQAAVRPIIGLDDSVPGTISPRVLIYFFRNSNWITPMMEDTHTRMSSIVQNAIRIFLTSELADQGHRREIQRFMDNNVQLKWFIYTREYQGDYESGQVVYYLEDNDLYNGTWRTMVYLATVLGMDKTRRNVNAPIATLLSGDMLRLLSTFLTGYRG